MASIIKLRQGKVISRRHSHRITKIMKSRIEEKLPDEDTQVKESLANLESGNYKDFPIEEYLKEIKE